MAATDLHAAAAQDPAPADVEILIHDDDRCAVVARGDRRRQARDARADHDHVGRVVPFDAAVAVLRGGLVRARSGDRDHAHAGGCAAREEIAPVDLSFAGRACCLAHPLTSRMPILAILLDDDDGSVRLPELRIKALPAPAGGRGCGRHRRSAECLRRPGRRCSRCPRGQIIAAMRSAKRAGQRFRRTRSSTSWTGRPTRLAATGSSTAQRRCCRLCNYINAAGNYSLRSYSLSPEDKTERVMICRGNAAVAPYAGPCPPK